MRVICRLRFCEAYSSYWYFPLPSEVDTQSRDGWISSLKTLSTRACQQLCKKEGLTARQQTFSASTEQTLKLHQIIAHLSGRQAVSMHYRGLKTLRGSWMCTICLVVAERATFVESGNQRLMLFWLGWLAVCCE